MLLCAEEDIAPAIKMVCSKRVNNVHIPVVLLEAPVQGTVEGNRLRAREVDRYVDFPLFFNYSRE